MFVSRVKSRVDVTEMVQKCSTYLYGSHFTFTVHIYIRTLELASPTYEHSLEDECSSDAVELWGYSVP